MEDLFCPNCNNILRLTIDPKTQKEVNMCLFCDTSFDLKSNIFYQKKITTNKKNIDEKLKNMYYDNTYQKKRIKCKNLDCKNNIIVYSKFEKMKNIYLCRICGTYWQNTNT